MTSRSRFVPPWYPASREGLAHARTDLGRAEDVAMAFAAQPNVSLLWQGWIDHAGHGVARQRGIVDTLARAVG